MRRMIYALIALCLLSCKSAKRVQSEDVQRHDSVNTTIMLDSVKSERRERESINVSEVRDSSRSVQLDTAGRIIGERIIVRVEREKKSEREEYEDIQRRLAKMDSIINVRRFEHDEHQEVTEKHGGMDRMKVAIFLLFVAFIFYIVQRNADSLH